MARNFRRSGWQRERELHTAVSARSALSLLHGRANDLLTHRTVLSTTPLRAIPARTFYIDCSIRSIIYKKKKGKERSFF